MEGFQKPQDFKATNVYLGVKDDNLLAMATLKISKLNNIHGDNVAAMHP